MRFEPASAAVVDAAIKIHTSLGPGLLEGAYQACMVHELKARGLGVRTQVRVPIQYDGIQIHVGYRIDILVEESVVVELKAVSKLLPIHHAQLMSYLKLSGHRIGLLLNFHVPHMRDGIKRIVV